MDNIHAVVELDPEGELVLISYSTLRDSLSLTSVERIDDINLHTYSEALVASVKKNFFDCSVSLVVLLYFERIIFLNGNYHTQNSVLGYMLLNRLGHSHTDSAVNLQNFLENKRNILLGYHFCIQTINLFLCIDNLFKHLYVSNSVLKRKRDSHFNFFELLIFFFYCFLS